MTSLREAARALVELKAPADKLETSGELLPELRLQIAALQEAYDAPPPGLEEVRAKLEELWTGAQVSAAFPVMER
jgi:hypothetical protein